MDLKPDIHRAYERIIVKHSKRLASLENAIDNLLELSRVVESELLKKMKPTIALSLKWKFDYLCKTLESPFELESDVQYWTSLVEMLKKLGDIQWFDLNVIPSEAKNPWRRTAEGFDLGWTTTTHGDQFEMSRQIAKERLDQIVQILDSVEYFKDKEILDSGCGPGRYIDLFRSYDPKKIVGLEQGERLINILRGRFAHYSNIEIVKGTCEKLEFKDESFDFVMSNGVMHHTPSDIKTMIEDHARVLRKGGVMFIMLIGKGGLELKMWKFLRNFLYDVPIESMIKIFADCISPLRLQGIVDHMYGEYQEVARDEFERWCSSIFKKVVRVPGISGLDVTPEIYKDDPYFDVRFGCGQLRYLCFK